MTQVLDRIRNGVDSAQMYGTLDAIKAEPVARRSSSSARTNHWIDGAHNRSTIKGFYGAGQEDTTRAEAFTSTPASPPSCSASTPARTRPSTCCTRSPPA